MAISFAGLLSANFVKFLTFKIMRLENAARLPSFQAFLSHQSAIFAHRIGRTRWFRTV
jgi:hypothetical protein